jgi:hypothetical protein
MRAQVILAQRLPTMTSDCFCSNVISGPIVAQQWSLPKQAGVNSTSQVPSSTILVFLIAGK